MAEFEARQRPRPGELVVTLVVTGLPGSGKTTLARALAAELRLPLISKDAIKETLADALGDKVERRPSLRGSASISAQPTGSATLCTTRWTTGTASQASAGCCASRVR